MAFFDRLITILVTATITSVVWIVAGGSIIENSTSKKGVDSVRPAEAAPSPTPTETTGGRIDGAATDGDAEQADPLHVGIGLTKEDVPPARYVVPVMNVRRTDLTDTFTDSRASGNRLHEAIDIMAPEGTSVVAAAPGTVEKLFKSDAGGNTIYIRSNDRKTIHYYAHLAEYAPGLKEGQQILQGQRIGTVGFTGNASPDAPHLHFAILRTTEDAKWWEPSVALNPYPLLTRK
ncbi:M23 family metallopeptidase [Altererythrobacter sp. MF3-039]|uniref:M23 family metallopeptidase n=1 Tax=Altererythrobacter sp. MF3-039 TaxID=3252901 RepID=UPI00390C6D08